MSLCISGTRKLAMTTNRPSDYLAPLGRLRWPFYAALVGLHLACFAGRVDNMDVHIGVILPNFTVHVSVDACPHLKSIQIEAGLLLERMEHFEWTGRTSGDPVRLNITFYDSKCSDSDGPIQAMQLYYRSTVHLLYGPCCKYALSPVGRYATAWGLPIITPGGLATHFSDRSTFPLLTQFVTPYRKMSNFFVKHLIGRYNWSHVFFLYHEHFLDRKRLGSSACSKTVDAIIASLKQEWVMNSASYSDDPQEHEAESNTEANRGDYYVDMFDEYFFDIHHWEEILSNVQRRSRVVILCASPATVRKIMIKAAEMKSFNNGEYVFFSIDLFSSQSKLKRPWYDESDTTERNQMARRVYEYLMTITVTKPDSEQHRNFSEELKRRSVRIHGDTIYGDEEENSFIGNFHDAIQLYALALNESLEAGHGPGHGVDIARRMRNRTFSGIAGTISIDENGERDSDYSLLDMDPSTGTFQVVANYYGKTKQYEEVSGSSIHWGGTLNRPPKDVPPFGFAESSAPQDAGPSPSTICLIVLLLLLVAIPTTAFVVRRFKKSRSVAHERDSGILIHNFSSLEKLETT